MPEPVVSCGGGGLTLTAFTVPQCSPRDVFPDGAKVRPHSWLPNLQRIACIKPMAVLLEGWRRSHRALSRVQIESPVFVGIQSTGQRGPPAFGP